MIEELVDYKNWESAQNKVEIINQISVSLRANRSVEPEHPKFPSIELFLKINEIDIFFSDYIMANLMNIQKSMMPPEPEKKTEEIEDDDEKEEEEEQSKQKDEEEKVGSSRKYMLKRMNRKDKKDRQFDNSDDEEEDPDEGEENFDVDERHNANDLKSISAKSLTDVENNPENQLMRTDKPKSSKVEQRILILFDRMKITIGEHVTVAKAKTEKYSHIIDTERSEIPHVNILELFFEGLEIEFNNGETQTLNLVMNRLIMRDLQEVTEKNDDDELVSKRLIPNCFHNILSNPDIEQEYDNDEGSMVSLGLKSVKTEDFKSIVDEESFAAVDVAKDPMTQLKLIVKIEKQTTSVEFLFADLRLTVTLPIFERLAKFQEKIARLQKESDEEKTKAKIEEVHKMLKKHDEVDSDSSESEDEKTKEERLERTRDILLLRTATKNKEESKGSEKGYYERFKEERNKYLMKGKKLKIKITHQISKINAKGRLSNFELWLPLDSTKEDSRVLSLSLSSHVGFKGSNITRHKINEITNEVIESMVQKDQQDANVVLTQLSISMINRHLIKVQNDLTSEKILLPSRIGLSYDKFLNAANDSDVTNIEMNIEPIDMKIGFRELNNFQELGQVMSEFAARIGKSSDEEEKDRTGPDYQQSKSREELDARDQELIKTLEDNVNRNDKPLISIRNRKVKQFIKMNIRLVSESINFSLMDDTGMYEYPLINFNISKILASVETETGEDDAANFILKKMGISKHPNLKLDACLLMESNYFNIDSGSYEPLLEPWMFSAIVLQKTKNSGMEIKLSSEEMLNINLTYGMALAVRQIMKKISQSAEEWEDEQKNEENKQRSLSQRKTRSLKKNSSKRKTIRVGEEDDETIGFYFENYLGLPMRITLENYDTWKEQGIELNEEDDDTSVINFQEWEDRGERNFRNLKELNGINKQVKKIQNGGKVVENFEDNIIRYDLYIEGFEPITGVPIEISGRRSYELLFAGQTEKQRKKDKYHYNITVNVKSEGKKKVISFESQLTLYNKTEFPIEIAQVLTQGLSEDVNQMSKAEIEKCTENINKDLDQKQKEKYEDLEQFETIYANGEVKVPLRWFLDEVAVFYKCERGDNIHYNQILPNLKKLFLKKDQDKKYEDLKKYHLLKQENIENTFIALETVMSKCRPTALDRPPHFECSLKPPICLNNMAFSDLQVVRHCDDKLVHTIKSGNYVYLYSGVMTERKQKDDDSSSSEDEKMAEAAQKGQAKDLQLYEGEVLFNKYIFKFVDDGNVTYESVSDYFYSMKVDYKFYPDGADMDASEDSRDDAVLLTFEVIKLNTFIYTPYILLNRSDIPIYFGEKGAKINKTKLINPHTSEFFNPRSKKKKKFSITVDDYEWADAFDITTLGMSGEASMKRKKEFDPENPTLQRFNSNNLNLGILISTMGSPFGKTTAIKFVPRYVFMNHCKKPLMLTQDWEGSGRSFYLKPEEPLTFNFEKKQKEDNFVKIREVTNEDSAEGDFKAHEEIEQTFWSSRFSIDDFEDFQVSIQSQEEGHDEEIKETSVQHEEVETFGHNNMDKVKWNEPSKMNNYRRFIRVIVTTQDEATLFIML